MNQLTGLPQEELESLWEQYSARLLAFIRKRVADSADAEDLLQEIFIRAHQHLCCLTQLSCPGCWMFQVTRRAIVDYYRTRRQHDPIPDNLPITDDSNEEDVEAELATSLAELIEKLPGIYRQALELTEYQGLSQVELAARLGISISGAKSRVQRARQMIRDMLLACCHFELDRRGRVIDYQERCCCCYPVSSLP